MQKRILEEAARRFGLDSNDLHLLHESSAHVLGDRIPEKSLFQCRRSGSNLLLRITESDYIDHRLVPGEVLFTNYLAERANLAPRALPSEGGNLVEILPAGGGREDASFAVVCFEELNGERINFDNPDDWNAQTFEQYGAMMGRMHSLSKEYNSIKDRPERIHWHRQAWFDRIDRYVPMNDTLARPRLEEVLQRMHALPTSEDSFGLIHGDAHPWNLMFQNRKLILVDWDFCEYNWYSFDLAIALWYAVMAPVDGLDRVAFARFFMTHFMIGYYTENSLDPFWLEYIPLFMRSRLIAKYILRYPDLASGEITESQKVAFYKWEDRIENDIPCVDIDFTEFAKTEDR